MRAKESGKDPPISKRTQPNLARVAAAIARTMELERSMKDALSLFQTLSRAQQLEVIRLLLSFRA